VKVLIIGATGATGRVLMREALEQGYEVTALARNPSAVAPEDHRPRVLEGNALDATEVEAAVAGQDAVLSALGTRSSRPTTLFSESTQPHQRDGQARGAPLGLRNRDRSRR
jgi:putative NADH-flavin reductase